MHGDPVAQFDPSFCKMNLEGAWCAMMWDLKACDKGSRSVSRGPRCHPLGGGLGEAEPTDVKPRREPTGQPEGEAWARCKPCDIPVNCGIDVRGRGLMCPEVVSDVPARRMPTTVPEHMPRRGCAVPEHRRSIHHTHRLTRGSFHCQSGNTGDGWSRPGAPRWRYWGWQHKWRWGVRCPS